MNKKIDGIKIAKYAGLAIALRFGYKVLQKFGLFRRDWKERNPEWVGSLEYSAQQNQMEDFFGEEYMQASGFNQSAYTLELYKEKEINKFLTDLYEYHIGWNIKTYPELVNRLLNLPRADVKVLNQMFKDMHGMYIVEFLKGEWTNVYQDALNYVNDSALLENIELKAKIDAIKAKVETSQQIIRTVLLPADAAYRFVMAAISAPFK